MKRLAFGMAGMALLVLSLFSGCATTGAGKLGTGGLLSVGSKAPPITIDRWIQGEPVTEFEEGKVYIVEFWATWCAPCIAGMPHLAEIQRNYPDKVRVIGVTKDSTTEVLKKLQENHPTIPSKTIAQVADYALAIDKGGQTDNAYMKAAQVGTIPNAFLIGKDGLIKYIGHPGKMDAALQAALNE